MAIRSIAVNHHPQLRSEKIRRVAVALGVATPVERMTAPITSAAGSRSSGQTPTTNS